MKKAISIMLCMVVIFSFAGCSGSGGEAAAWTREGYFENEDGDFLSVSLSDMDGYEGWYVGCMIGEDSYGNVIKEEGGKLHGNLVPEGEDGEFIVTVTDEGKDGVTMEVEGGETYHFTEMDMSAYESGITIMVNTEGDGYIGCAVGDEELGPEKSFEATSTQISLPEPQSITLGTRAEEGWKFVKWTRDGEDYSTDPQITIEDAEDAVYVAVFDVAE